MPSFRLRFLREMFCFTNSLMTALWPNLAARWTGVIPDLFSSSGEAPQLSRSFTTSVWPPSVATWSGVESVILFLLVVTMLLSNFSSSSSTRTLPFLAAMCAEVFPSFVVVVTRVGCFCRNSPTTSGWSDWAARWICNISGQVRSGQVRTPTGFWPKSSVLSTPAPRLINMSQAACFPAEAARWRGVCFFCNI